MSAFDTLSLPETATPDEVKARWRELASTHHPDNGGDADEFHKYRRAYEEAHRIAGEPKVCGNCGGAGKVVVARGFNQVKLPCEVCGGYGAIK